MLDVLAKTLERLQRKNSKQIINTCSFEQEKLSFRRELEENLLSDLCDFVSYLALTNNVVMFHYNEFSFFFFFLLKT